jgi:hypothetical protein
MNLGLSFTNFRNILKKLLSFKTWGTYSCTVWVLNRWKFKSACKDVTDWSDILSVLEWRRADHQGICRNMIPAVPAISGEHAIQRQPDVAVLNCWTQFEVVWHTGTLLFLLMLKWHLNTHCIMVAESSFLKSVPIANLCSFSQCFMMTDAFNLFTVRHKLQNPPLPRIESGLN